MTTATEPRAHINAWIDPADRERLVQLAREADRSLSAEVRRAVTEHLKRAHREEQQT
jgi:hypothetical protein